MSSEVACKAKHAYNQKWHKYYQTLPLWKTVTQKFTPRCMPHVDVFQTLILIHKDSDITYGSQTSVLKNLHKTE